MCISLPIRFSSSFICLYDGQAPAAWRVRECLCFGELRRAAVCVPAHNVLHQGS